MSSEITHPLDLKVKINGFSELDVVLGKIEEIKAATPHRNVKVTLEVDCLNGTSPDS